MLDQEAAAAAHSAELGGRGGEGVAQGIDEGVGTGIDPPTALMLLELLPGGGAGGDDREAAGEGFGDDEAEVFAERGQDKEVGIEEEVEFGVAPEFVLEDHDVVEGEGMGETPGVLEVAGFIRADDEEFPERVADAGPGAEEVGQAFFGVDA